MKDGWDIKKLGEVCFITMGQSPNSESYNKLGDGLPFFQGCSDFGAIHPLVTTWCNQPNKIANPNDILMSVRAPIGTLNIADSKCCIGRGLAAFTQKEGVTINKFLYYFLLSSKGDLQSKGTGATFKAIGKELIKNYAIKLPSLTEQQHIVEELDLLSSIIEKKKAQLNELDNLAQSLFYEMFGDPITNDKGWEVKELKSICSKITDGTHDTPQRLDKGVKFITGKHIRPFSVDYDNSDYVTEEVHREIILRCNPEKGDVLYTNIGAGIGNAAINTVDYEFSMKNVALLKLCKIIVNGYYMEFYLNNDFIKTNIIENFSNGGAQKFLSLKSIARIPVPIPPYDLQTQFASKIEAIEHQKEFIKQSIKEVETLFNSRMDYYFN